MDLVVGDMGFIFCGKHPFLMARIRARDSFLVVIASSCTVTYFPLVTDTGISY